MNTIYPYASHAMEVSSGMFQQGYHSLQGWGERAVLYLQTIPQTLAQHPNALIATIAVANALFLTVLNTAFNRLEKWFTDGQPRSWTILVIAESFAAVSIFGFNLLVSKAAKAQMTQQTMVAITATVLAARFLFNHWRSPAQPLAQPQEKEVQKTPEKNGRKQDPEILEDAVSEKQEERSPQEIRTAALSKKELAAAQTKAAQLHFENCKLNERIADVELQLGELRAAEAAKDEAIQKRQSLEREIEVERAAMKKENDQLKSDRAKAEDDLVTEKDRSKSEIDALQKTIAALKDEKAQAERLQKRAEADCAAAQKTQDATVKSHIAEKEAALKEKDQALREKSEAESMLQKVRTKNKQLAADKALCHKRIEELEAALSAKGPAPKTPGASVPPATPQDAKKTKAGDKKVDSPGTLGKIIFM